MAAHALAKHLASHIMLRNRLCPHVDCVMARELGHKVKYNMYSLRNHQSAVHNRTQTAEQREAADHLRQLIAADMSRIFGAVDLDEAEEAPLTAQEEHIEVLLREVEKVLVGESDEL